MLIRWLSGRGGTLATMNLGGRSRLWDRATVAVLFVAFAIALLTFTDYGMSWDEPSSARYGKAVMRFLFGLGADSAAVSDPAAGRGGTFHALVEMLGSVLPLSPLSSRRIATVVVGGIGLVATWGTARKLAGSRAGLLSVLVLLSGSYWGHLFMNPSDLPFAAAYVSTLYFVVRLVEELPSVRTSTAVKFSVALGLTLGTRLGGGVLVVLLLSMLALHWIRFLRGVENREGRRRLRSQLLRAVALSFVVTTTLVLLFWPAALVDPVGTFLHGLSTETAFPKEEEVLFAGTYHRAYGLPRAYWLVYTLITFPEVLLAALALVPLFVPRLVRSLRTGPWFPSAGYLVIALAGTAPLVYATLWKPTDYDGIRHFLFVAPPLSIVAGVTLCRSLGWLAAKHRRAELYGIAVLSLVFAGHLARQIRLHPFQYMTYNHVVGGVHGAEDSFALDYWGTSVQHLIPAIITDADEAGVPAGVTILVNVCGPLQVADYYLPENFQFTEEARNAHLFIGTSKWSCHRLFEEAPLVAATQVDGVPLAVVRRLRQYPRK